MSDVPATLPTAPAPEAPAGARLASAAGRLLPFVAIAIFVLAVGATLAVAGDTLGYDFRSYYDAASRVLAGQPLYSASAADTGLNGGFKYPPPFVLPVLPLALLPWQAAAWIWVALTLIAFAVGTAVMPVRPAIRWSVLLLAGLSFPFVYATKLGQVGSLLYLLFVIGWRWLDRPGVLGATSAVGALGKVQPGLVLVWAALTGRWRAVFVGGAVLVGMAVVAAIVLGLGTWVDFLALPGRVSDPITTPHNFTVGAVAYQAGLPRDAASVLQWASTAGVVAILVVTALRLPAVPSYLVALIASQLLSPILWDHYAMLLLVPVAWLLERGRRWAAVIPLATSVMLVGAIPPVFYPAAFWVTLAAVALEGARGQNVVPATR